MYGCLISAQSTLNPHKNGGAGQAGETSAIDIRILAIAFLLLNRLNRQLTEPWISDRSASNTSKEANPLSYLRSITYQD